MKGVAPICILLRLVLITEKVIDNPSEDITWVLACSGIIGIIVKWFDRF
jgi:hypothetical protein